MQKGSYLIVYLIVMAHSVFAQQVALSGRVTKSDGTAAAGLTVVLENNGTSAGETVTDVAGNYSMSVNTGTYTQLRVRNLGSDIAGLPSTIEHTAFTAVVIAGATTKDITMPAYIQISGFLLYSNGDTIKGAAIEAKKWENMSQAPPWDNATSGIDGSFTLYQEAGGIKFWITPSGADQVTLEDTIGQDTTMNLVIPKTIVVSGTVTSHSGALINGITLAFEIGTQQYETMTNPSGAYSKSLTPGTYRIRLRNGVGPTSADGVPSNLEETILSSIVLSHDTAIAITAPFYPAVRCSVVTNTGTPVQNIALQSKKWEGSSEAPPWDKDTTTANGIGTLYVDSSDNKIWLYPPLGSSLVAMDFVITVARDTTVVITMTEGAVLSGVIKRVDSSAVAGVCIALEKDADQWMDTTDASGQYSIAMQPGIYRLRVRNTGAVISGIPATLEHTVADTLHLSQSRVVNIVLPKFPTISGVVKNAAGAPVGNVVLQAKRWDNGSEAPPWASYTTGTDGAFSLTIGVGTNKIWITPQAGTGMGAFSFISDFQDDATRDIFIPDQAKGVTRLQPSVITRGESGTIMITGVGSNFTGTVTIDLGDSITVTNVKVISAITLEADIAIATNALCGTRDVIVTYGSEKLIGPNLLSVTAPASAKVTLDAQSKTTDEVVISDGTGTELIIPQGTEIIFPQGSDSVIAYKAPILESKDPNLATGELTTVQRTLSPAGLQFNDTVQLTCQYKDQDVEGMDESTLKPYFYNDAGSGTGTLGDTMAVLKNDTAANTITFAIPHFSMFRIATGNLITRRVTNSLFAEQRTNIVSVIQKGNALTMLRFSVSAADAARMLTIAVYDCKGRLVKMVWDGTMASGLHSIYWNNRSSDGKLLGNGLYFVNLLVGNEKQMTRQILLVR